MLRAALQSKRLNMSPSQVKEPLLGVTQKPSQVGTIGLPQKHCCCWRCWQAVCVGLLPTAGGPCETVTAPMLASRDVKKHIVRA